jgi:hypothetical protein
MSAISDQMEEAKQRLRIPALWTLLGLSGTPPRTGTGVCHSPFRPDKKPSFSIYDEGRRWKDQGTGEGGDAGDFIMQAEGRDRRDAIRRFLVLAGMQGVSEGLVVRTMRRFDARPTVAAPDVSSLHRPTDAEVQDIASLRHLDPSAVGLVAGLGILRTGYVNGVHVWALVDGPKGEPARIAEYRRIDGLRLGDGKTLCIRGSKKDWPAGVSLLGNSATWRAVLLCEGMPDFLAAAHFAHRFDKYDLCPVAVLGRTNQKLHPEAIELLAGRRIRVFPHADADGGGMAAAECWASQLPGSDVDAFHFDGLIRRDGRPVKDLNDCAVIHPDHESALVELLP